jgi:hypothetical protein
MQVCMLLSIFGYKNVTFLRCSKCLKCSICGKPEKSPNSFKINHLEMKDNKSCVMLQIFCMFGMLIAVYKACGKRKWKGKQMEKYKYFLRVHGRPETTALHAAVTYLKQTFSMVRDSDFSIIDYSTYVLLCAQGLLGLQDGQVKPGQVGMINLSTFNRYTTTWEKVNCALIDYIAGYEQACEELTFNKNKTKTNNL